MSVTPLRHEQQSKRLHKREVSSDTLFYTFLSRGIDMELMAAQRAAAKAGYYGPTSKHGRLLPEEENQLSSCLPRQKNLFTAALDDDDEVADDLHCAEEEATKNKENQSDNTMYMEIKKAVEQETFKFFPGVATTKKKARSLGSVDRKRLHQPPSACGAATDASKQGSALAKHISRAAPNEELVMHAIDDDENNNTEQNMKQQQPRKRVEVDEGLRHQRRKSWCLADHHFVHTFVEKRVLWAEEDGRLWEEDGENEEAAAGDKPFSPFLLFADATTKNNADVGLREENDEFVSKEDEEMQHNNSRNKEKRKGRARRSLSKLRMKKDRDSVSRQDSIREAATPRISRSRRPSDADLNNSDSTEGSSSTSMEEILLSTSHVMEDKSSASMMPAGGRAGSVRIHLPVEKRRRRSKSSSDLKKLLREEMEKEKHDREIQRKDKKEEKKKKRRRSSLLKNTIARVVKKNSEAEDPQETKESEEADEGEDAEDLSTYLSSLLESNSSSKITTQRSRDRRRDKTSRKKDKKHKRERRKEKERRDGRSKDDNSTIKEEDAATCFLRRKELLESRGATLEQLFALVVYYNWNEEKELERERNQKAAASSSSSSSSTFGFGLASFASGSGDHPLSSSSFGTNDETKNGDAVGSDSNGGRSGSSRWRDRHLLNHFLLAYTMYGLSSLDLLRMVFAEYHMPREESLQFFAAVHKKRAKAKAEAESFESYANMLTAPSASSNNDGEMATMQSSYENARLEEKRQQEMLKVEGMRDRRLKPWNRDLDLEREQLIHLRRRLAYFLQEWVSLLPWETQPYHKLLFRLTQRMQKDSLKEESRFIRMKVWALSGTNQKRNAAAKAMKLPSSASSSAASSQVHSLDLSSVTSPSSSSSTTNTNVKIPACISPRGHNIKPRNIAAGGTITEASLLANRAKTSHSTYTICSPTSSTRANGSHITVRDKHASMSIPSTSPTGAFLSSALQQHRHRPNPLFDSPSSSYNPSTPVRSGGGSNYKKSDTSSSHSSAPSLLSLSLTKLKVNDLAKELTRMEFELFCRIEPTELLRDIVNTLKPLSDNYNKISFWVATQVITHKSQAKVIAKFIAVADKCMEMRNFATTMAILCGLNLQVAARAVEPLLKELPSKLVVAYERMKAQMFFSETNKNDKIYKELIHKEVRRLERSQFNRVQLPSSSTRVLQTSSDKAKTLSDVTTTTEEDAGEVSNNNENINHNNNEEVTEEANEEEAITKEEEDESNNKLPALVIPFAGIYAKYLTAINENPTVLPSGRLNLCKLQLWGKILYEIYVLQRKQKNVIRRNSELYAYLRNVRFESEESLWGISSMKKSQCIDASNRRK